MQFEGTHFVKAGGKPHLSKKFFTQPLVHNISNPGLPKGLNYLRVFPQRGYIAKILSFLCKTFLSRWWRQNKTNIECLRVCFSMDTYNKLQIFAEDMDLLKIFFFKESWVNPLVSKQPRFCRSDFFSQLTIYTQV